MRKAFALVAFPIMLVLQINRLPHVLIARVIVFIKSLAAGKGFWAAAGLASTMGMKVFGLMLLTAVPLIPVVAYLGIRGYFEERRAQRALGVRK